MKKQRGGKRPNAGRKKKDYETKIIRFDVMVSEIKPIKNLVKEFRKEFRKGVKNEN